MTMSKFDLMTFLLLWMIAANSGASSAATTAEISL